jgi:hypothetical protein
MYQDGVLHALSYVLSSARLGEKKESFERELTETENTLHEMWLRQDPIEIAYWTGRTEAMHAFCSRRDKEIPTYFHPYRLEPILKFVRGSAWSRGKLASKNAH